MRIIWRQILEKCFFFPFLSLMSCHHSKLLLLYNRSSNLEKLFWLGIIFLSHNRGRREREREEKGDKEGEKLKGLK